MRSLEVREAQKKFLIDDEDPRPTRFFMQYHYRRKNSGFRDYKLRLDEALQDDPYSEKLSSLKRKWEAYEYRNDWESYEDERRSRKADVCYFFFI